MERPTKIIATPMGNKVAIKTYFTQAELTEVQRILAGDTVIQAGKEAETGTKTSDLIVAEAKAMEIAVVSFNDSKENPVKTLRDDLPASEYQSVSREVMAILTVDFPTAK